MSTSAIIKNAKEYFIVKFAFCPDLILRTTRTGTFVGVRALSYTQNKCRQLSLSVQLIIPYRFHENRLSCFLTTKIEWRHMAHTVDYDL